MNIHDWNLGEVKFFNNDRGFGFINDAEGIDIYFVHITKLKTQSIQEKDKVVFNLRPSGKKVGAFDAINVIKLLQFDDYSFLMKRYFELKNPSFKEAIIKILPQHCQSYLINEEIDKTNSISNEIEYKAFLGKWNELKRFFNSPENMEILNNSFLEKLKTIATNEFKIRSWIDNYIKIPPDLRTIGSYLQGKNKTEWGRIYFRLEPNTRFLLFKNYVLRKDLSKTFDNLLYFLTLETDFDLQGKFISILVNDFKDIKLSIDNSEKLFKTLPILAKNVNKGVYNLFVELFYHKAADSIKLKLWVEDYVDEKDYDIYFINFIFLSTYNQITLIKKLFYLLSQNEPNITYERILTLKNLTHAFQEGRYFNLDFSCNVILSSIENIKNGLFLNEESIFQLLVKHVEHDPTSLLTLEGFFERCTGRTIPDKIQEDNDGRKTIIDLKVISQPRNVEFCEGTKFGDDGKDRTYKHDCWWCRGGICYDANQSVDLPNSYRDYSLSNFLSILNIPFNPRSYFDFLGLLNKINIFLQHIHCRTCDYVLQPFKENHYGFYRVSNFICSNPQCSNKENIYLSHCLGAKKTSIKSRCDNLIDSRDTKRCNYNKHNPSNNFERYGPYVCDWCGSCCSQKSLEKKQSELIERNWKQQPGLDWKVKNKVGHLERGETFCYKCGVEMINNEKEYKEFKNLLENPDNTFRRLKKGTNNYGDWYLIKAEEIFFEKAKEVGFRVSATKEENPTLKFVSDGNINFLICKTCNTKYNKSKFEFVKEKQEVN